VGEPIPIDHATAHQTVVDNLTRHLDGLESTLSFLEDSSALNNTLELLFGEEEEEGEEEKDEGLEIDLSELRDGLIEIVCDRLMVEETATVADDGLSITYSVDAEYFCAGEPEEDESPEEEKERLEDEAECAERLEANPLVLQVTSDAIGDVNISVQVGDGAEEVLSLQVHDDQISAQVEMAPMDGMVGLFVDPDDFTLPASMAGTLGVEIRQDGEQVYTARFAILDDIAIVPDAEQDPFAFQMSKAADPGRITFDGIAGTIAGALQIDALEASVPWQMIVDMFYDDEGYWEGDEWFEPTEPPDVEEAMVVSIPGVSGTIAYAASDDAYRLTEMGLGGETMTVMVDDGQIVGVDVNPDNGRTMDLVFAAPGEHDIGFTFSPDFETRVAFAWAQFEDHFEDLPTFLRDETLGVRMDESDAPELRILDVKEDTQVQMASGRLTLFSTAMSEDVVIEEGECITGIDEDALTEEERDALHDVFGSLMGATCEE
jgi:hypothetical protein